MITPGDLAVVAVAVTIVVTFFLVARRFIRRAEASVNHEDHPAAEPATRRH